MAKVTKDINGISIAEMIRLRSKCKTDYDNVVRAMFSGHIGTKLKGRFLGTKTKDQDAMLDEAENFKRIIERELRMAKKDVEDEEKFVENVDSELEKAEKELAQMQKKVDALRKKSQAAHKCFDEFKDAQALIENRLTNTENRIKGMKTLVLIHPSATLKQVKSYPEAVFMVTDEDEEFMKKAGMADAVFANYGHFIENIPKSVLRSSSEEQRSFIAFADMVISYWMENDGANDFKIVFSSIEIAELLKANGFEQ